MRWENIIATAGLALLFACQTTPPIAIPQTTPVPQGPPPKPKIALVLGGGAARG